MPGWYSSSQSTCHISSEPSIGCILNSMSAFLLHSESSTSISWSIIAVDKGTRLEFGTVFSSPSSFFSWFPFCSSPFSSTSRTQRDIYIYYIEKQKYSKQCYSGIGVPFRPFISHSYRHKFKIIKITRNPLVELRQWLTNQNSWYCTLISNTFIFPHFI